MKKLLLLVVISMYGFSSKAQSNDDLAFFQSIWGMEKRAIVQEYMGIVPESPFWQEYDAYEYSRKELYRERIEILSEYADNFTSLSDDKATDLINRAAANNIALQKLLKKTFKKVSKTVSAVEAAKFIQLENYFLIAIQMNIQENIPFIGELDGMVK
jgi:methanogenic corrinoid protein MtbC1